MTNEDNRRLEQEIDSAVQKALDPWLARVSDPKARDAIRTVLSRDIKPHAETTSYRIMQIENGGLVFVPKAEAEIVYRGQIPHVKLPDESEHCVIESQDEGYWIFRNP